jgi:very-short-patch-repair endonuclease
MNKKILKEQIVKRCNLKFGYRYDYSLVSENSTKNDIVRIICPDHGVIEQRFKIHMLKGCIYCIDGKTTNKHIKEHIRELVDIHGDRFEYLYEDKIKWSQMDKIKVLCKKHNFEFKKSIKSLKTYKANCKYCIDEIYSLRKFKGKGTIKFIEDSTKIHGDKYDYSLVEYKNGSERVRIICKKHGEFLQIAKNHTNIGQGCPDCNYENNRISFDYFLEKAIKTHGYIYDYSAVEFKSTEDYINIYCSRHGVFKQSVKNHIYNKNGCPICRESRGEKGIRAFLIRNKINFNTQYKFENCRYVRRLIFDFYLPYHNICIEYDGEHHYGIGIYSENFNSIKVRDNIKTNFCDKNNIKLIRIPYWDINNVEEILKKEIILE